MKKTVGALLIGLMTGGAAVLSAIDDGLSVRERLFGGGSGRDAGPPATGADPSGITASPTASVPVDAGPDAAASGPTTPRSPPTPATIATPTPNDDAEVPREPQPEADRPAAAAVVAPVSAPANCLGQRQEAIGDGPLRVSMARCARIALASDRARYGTRLSGWITNVSDGAVAVATVSDYYRSALGWEHHVGSWSAMTSGGSECLVKDFGNGNLPTAATGVFAREAANAARLDAATAIVLQPGQTSPFNVMFYCTEASGGEMLEGAMTFYTGQRGERWQRRTISFGQVAILPRVD